ncbi:MAG: hypothetical protein K8R25_05605 [Methanosarcinales archaeon]|nr:hypothetical protein [Methanosarcinales archaeon]
MIKCEVEISTQYQKPLFKKSEMHRDLPSGTMVSAFKRIRRRKNRK